MDVGMMFLFYGLYYGVLGRDFAEICTDKIATQIGVGDFDDVIIHTWMCVQYYTETGLPKKTLEPDVCAVCGQHIACYADGASVHADGEGTGPEAVYRLSCSHL